MLIIYSFHSLIDTHQANHEQMEGELTSLVFAGAALAAALCYSYLVASRIHGGRSRVLALLPVFLLFARLPFYLTTVHLRSTLAFLLWLTTFKIILLALQQGPLSYPGLPLPTFLALAAFPVQIQIHHKHTPHGRPESDHLLNIPPLVGYPVKVGLLASLISFYPQRHMYPRTLVVALYGLHGYLMLDLVLALCAAMAHLVLGPSVALEPQFSAPYLSSSLQDFWSGRWNVMVSRMLHVVVYKPVRARFGAYAGIVASFFVSGIAHEVLFYCGTLERQSGEATCFFLLQGLCVVAEIEAKMRLSRRGWGPLPRAVAAPLTVGFVTATAMLLLYPPIMGGAAEEKAVAECVAVAGAVRGAVGRACTYASLRAHAVRELGISALH